jgi:fructose-1,6-bisphosphatase I
LKGQGVYWKYDSKAHKSNLHLIYEILPMAFLIEQAGGLSDNGKGESVLDLVVEGYEQRVSFIAGSSSEVKKII